MSTVKKTPASGSRDRGLDSAKGILIVLVVFGHFLETVPSAPRFVTGLYTSIYVFHMPAFVFIAGLLSETTLSRGTGGKTVSALLVPFIAFTIIYEAISFALHGDISGYAKGLAPNWILWFLWSLFLWRLAAPAVLAMRFPIIATAAVSIVFFGVPQTGYFMGIGRTLTFFPFFVLGLLYGRPFVRWVGDQRATLTFVAIVVFLFGLYLFSGWSIAMLYGSQSFPAQNLSFLNGASTKLATYLLSTIMGACFLCVTLKTSVFSRFGRMSLHIYLWHGVLVILYRHFGAQLNVSTLSAAVQVLVLLALSVAIAFLFSSQMVVRATAALLVPVNYFTLAPGGDSGRRGESKANVSHANADRGT